MQSGKYKDYTVDTIFIGGGTPSILDSFDIGEILDLVRFEYKLSDDAEITMEANPGTLNYPKLEMLKNFGINRLSIGLQSADDNELRTIGRIHTYDEFLQTYKWARQAGFDNINIDLMSALPGQNMESWVSTLLKVMALKPEHISAYSLIIEEGTLLYDKLSDYPPIPDEDEDRRMYQETKKLMAMHGYERYEISNYSVKGHECRHNIVYWQRGNYVGFGLGASSMVDNTRWKNIDDIESYLKNAGKPDKIKTDIQQLGEIECMEEFMFLGLRMTKGVSAAGFKDIFGKDMTDIYGSVLDKWTKLGMIVYDDGFYRLSDEGIDVSNVILADFIL